jgi:uncharacterized linocin/CFP29 family protein
MKQTKIDTGYRARLLHRIKLEVLVDRCVRESAFATKIGYLNHTDSVVLLYLQETLTFLLLTTEAAVALTPPTDR